MERFYEVWNQIIAKFAEVINFIFDLLGIENKIETE